ncbi:MAG: hypothetical protein FWH26_10670, partial [Oscillospiraceae bacterium]|nr:hypothetical protein [Oscillospiraceae bacterium]
QVLNVNPFYLTGVVSAPGECTGEALRDLLMQNGYRKLLAEIELAEKKVKRAKKAEEEGAAAAKAAEAAEAPPAAAAEPAEAAAEEAPAEEAIAALAAEDLQALLSALFIRAGAGVAKAQETLKEVQSLLLA